MRHALDYAQQQYHRTLVALHDTLVYPRSTKPDGSWKSLPAHDWTSGFFPGILWHLSAACGDSVLRSAAIRYTEGLASQQYNTGTHDLGFMMGCSFGNALRLAPSPQYREVLLQSARSLAGRFSPRVGCIKSWDWSTRWTFPVIIDNMMNLELLFWAAKNGGGEEMRSIAIRHAETTLRNHFRADGSTYHVVDFDTATGNVRRKQTHQGYADESVWARGQAWAIYGYTMTYRETGDQRFYDAAVRAAGFFLKHLPDDHVPYWDFNAPDIPNAARDASAAAIAASGLFELASLSKDPAQEAMFRRKSSAILGSLMQAPYFSEGTSSAAVLNYCTGHHPGGLEIDVSLVYADYYFIEALVRSIHGHK
jgi:hypothetical protein